MTALEKSLYNWEMNYIEFRDYFTDYLSDYCKEYNLETIDGCCECIVNDILTIIKDEIDKNIKLNKEISLEEISEQIPYESIIEDVFYEYHSYVTLLVGYKKCMEYLMENDISLRETLKLVKEHGYNIEKLDVEKLANILYRHKQNEKLEKFKEDIIDIIKIFCKYYIIHIYEYKMNSYK